MILKVVAIDRLREVNSQRKRTDVPNFQRYDASQRRIIGAKTNYFSSLTHNIRPTTISSIKC